MTDLYYLPKGSPEFPPADHALKEPDGLLAMGGDLNPEWLTAAYSKGIFPWFNSDEEEILWWCPSERAVIRPGNMRISKSLKKLIRKERFCVSFDRSFDEVINNCSIRNDELEDTWITERMKKAYKELHTAGLAHSIEVRLDNVLVGGLYGVSLGTMFFGESMFSRVSNASKIALYHLEKKLLEWQFSLIDCQIMNPHLDSLGAINIPRRQFIDMVDSNPITKTKQGNWSSQI